MLIAKLPLRWASRASQGDPSRSSHSCSGSFFEKNKRGSFVFAQQKIVHLAQFGYVFMGNLPTYQEIPCLQKSPMCRYLFTRNGKYYQFKGFEFLDEDFVLRLDEQHEPLDTAFSKIVEGNFIYLMVRERFPSRNGYAERLVLMLKPDPALSGHALLAGPYGKKCALLMMANPPLNYSKEFLRAQIETLPGFPKSAFVLAGGALFFLCQFGDELYCLPMHLKSDDVKTLKIELAKLGLPIVETLPADQECVCIVKKLTSVQCAKITETAQFNPEFEVIGGEVYFHNEHILLINHKSSSFRADAASAERLISALWGSHGAVAFHPAVEKLEVDHELAVRKDKLNSSSTASYISSPVLQFDVYESKEFSAVKPDEDKGERGAVHPIEPQVSKPLSPIYNVSTSSLSCRNERRYGWFETELTPGVVLQAQHPSPSAPSPNEEEQVKTGFCCFLPGS